MVDTSLQDTLGYHSPLCSTLPVSLHSHLPFQESRRNCGGTLMDVGENNFSYGPGCLEPPNPQCPGSVVKSWQQQLHNHGAHMLHHSQEITYKENI